MRYEKDRRNFETLRDSLQLDKVINPCSTQDDIYKIEKDAKKRRIEVREYALKHFKAHKMRVLPYVGAKNGILVYQGVMCFERNPHLIQPSEMGNIFPEFKSRLSIFKSIKGYLGQNVLNHPDNFQALSDNQVQIDKNYYHI